jgi:very-short-patch-repair endonuclease
MADEVTEVEGIPVTSPARTQLDLAAVLTKRQLERVIDEAEVHRLLDRLSLPQLLDRHRGRRGAGKLRSVLDFRTPGGFTRNEFEERFVAVLDAHGVSRPRLNADIAVRGRFFNVDCLWRRERVVVELDGREAHGTARAFEDDRQRDRLLVVDGLRVMHVTWAQLRDEPEAVVRDVKRLLAARNA